MVIDWFTIVAQVLNFLILVWLMKRFLYKPVLHAIDEREKGIAAKLADAAALELKAQKDGVELKRKNQEFDNQRSELLLAAISAAQGERTRLFDEARRAGSALRLKQAKAQSEETQTLLEAIGDQAQKELVAISRKILGDLADTTLEASMVEVFLRRLRALEGSEKAALGVSTSSGPLVVRTGLAISAALQDSIQSALGELFAGQPIRFEAAPELVCGIEMSASGHKVAWSVADYLTSLEQGIKGLLEKGKTDAV